MFAGGPPIPSLIPFQEIERSRVCIDVNHPLGKGGFGVVYKALLYQDDGNIDVAVKMPKIPGGFIWLPVH